MHSTPILLLVTTALFVLGACRATTLVEPQLVLQGQVIDDESREAVTGADVVLLGTRMVTPEPGSWFEVTRVTTGADGIFSFPAIAEMRDLPHLSIEIRAEQYGTIRYTPLSGIKRFVGAHPRLGKARYLGRVEVSRARTIRGVVTAANGTPISAAAVTWLPQNDGPEPPTWSAQRLPTTSDEAGRFEISVPDNASDLLCTAPGYASVVLPIVTEEDDEQRFELEPATQLRGRVVASDGVPIRGARIQVETIEEFHDTHLDRTATSALPVTTSGDDGTFVLDQLPRLRRVAGLVSSDEHVARRFQHDDSGSDMKIVLNRGRRLRFELTSPDAGEVPPIAFVSTPELSEHIAVRQGDTFETPPIPTSAGSGVLLVHGFAPRGVDWPAGSNDHDLGRISLERGRSLTVDVTQPDGTPLPHAYVSFFGESGFGPWGANLSLQGLYDGNAFSDRHGRCRLGGMLALEGQVFVEALGHPTLHRHIRTSDREMALKMTIPEPASLRLNILDSSGRSPGMHATWRLTSRSPFSLEATATLVGFRLGWAVSDTTELGESRTLACITPDVAMELDLSVGEDEITLQVHPLLPLESRELEIDIATLDWGQDEASDGSVREVLAEAVMGALEGGSGEAPITIRVTDASGQRQPDVKAWAWTIDGDAGDRLEHFLSGPAEGSSNEAGVIVLHEVPYVPLAISLAGPGGVAVVHLEPDFDRDTAVDVQLEEGVPYSGRVVNEAALYPDHLDELDVELASTEDPDWRWADHRQTSRTAPDGTFSFVAPPGPVRLTINSAGDEDIVHEADDASLLPQVIPLAKVGWALRISSPDLSRARTMSLHLEDTEGEWTWRQSYQSTPREPIHVPGPRATIYRCTVRTSGHEAIIDHAVEVLEDQADAVTIELAPLARPVALAIETVTGGGQPVPWVLVQAATSRTDFGSFHNMNGFDHWTYTDRNGRAVIAVDRADSCRLLTTAVGFGALDHALTAEELEKHGNRQHPLRLHFLAEATLLIHTVDEDDEAVKHDVSLRYTLPDGSEAYTDLGEYDESVAGYRFTGVAPGSYTIQVSDFFGELVLAEQVVELEEGASRVVTVVIEEQQGDEAEVD